MRMYRHLLSVIIFTVTLGVAQTTISVLDFQANGISPTEASILTDRFRAELIQLKEYSVIERAVMEEVLQEQGFQQSGCVSTECVVEVGQLLGAQQMVGGSIGQLGNVFTITARIIDVESGEILNVTTYDHEGDIGSVLKTGMRQVALDLFTKLEVASVSALINTSDLYIDSNPTGAEIILDTKKMGYTPLLIKELVVGSHELLVTTKGFLPINQMVIIKSGKLDSVIVDFENIEKLRIDIDRYNKSKTRFRLISTSSVVLGGVFLYLANNNYKEYQDAIKDVDAIYNRVQTQDLLSSLFFGIGAGTAVSSFYYSYKIKSISNKLKVDK